MRAQVWARACRQSSVAAPVATVTYTCPEPGPPDSVYLLSTPKLNLYTPQRYCSDPTRLYSKTKWITSVGPFDICPCLDWTVSTNRIQYFHCYLHFALLYGILRNTNLLILFLSRPIVNGRLGLKRRWNFSVLLVRFITMCLQTGLLNTTL